MRKMTSLLFVCVFALVLSCQQAPQISVEPAPKPIDYAAIKAQLEHEQQLYAQAWCNKDMNAISEIWSHDDDITIWGPEKRDRLKGWEGSNSVKAFYQAGFDGAQKIDFKIHDVLVKVAKSGTAAVITYYVENDFIDNNGKLGKITPRVTVARELVDGKWKTIHGDASYSIAEIKAMK